MAWCPKCKVEYRKGITVCAECGSMLVEEQKTEAQVPVLCGEATLISELQRFLEYNKMQHVKVTYDENKDAYVLSVQQSDQEAAVKAAKVFMEQKAEELEKRRELDKKLSGAKGGDEDTEEQQVQVPKGVYMNSEQKAEDNRSSAWTLLLLGGLGILFVILCLTGILPFRVGNQYLFFGVMSAIFILFVVMGFVSMKNARFFEKNAESENNLKKTVLDWCKTNLVAEKIDSMIQYKDEIAEEELYLRRYEIIKYLINHQFMNLDQGLVERLIDDEVYDCVFSSDAE